MISKLLALPGPVKIGTIIALLISLIGFIYWYDKSRYNAGYNAAKAEQLKAVEAAVKATEQRLTLKYNKVINQKNRERSAALRLAEQLRKQVTEVSYDDLQKINQNSNCARLGADYVRVFNDLIGEPPKPVRNKKH